MKEDVTDANAHSSRRQFLQIGAGLAGAVSVGAVLAACSSPASQTQLPQAATAPEMEAVGPVTIPGAYLIIARYNRDKWNGLKKELGVDEQHQAHETAEELFPERRYPVPQLTSEERAILQRLPTEELRPVQALTLVAQVTPQEGTVRGQIAFQQLPDEERDDFEPLTTEELNTSLAKLRGVRLLNSFHTRAFMEIDGRVLATRQPGPIKLVTEKTEQEQRREVDALFAAPGTSEKDPGMGWIAVVDYDKYDAFVAAMGGKAGPLWRMYDIEVIPLNNDRTTKDVYDFMTPVSWKK